MPSDWSQPGSTGASLIELLHRQKGKPLWEGARDLGKELLFGQTDLGLSPNPMAAGMVINRRNLPRMLEQWQSNARNRPMLNLLGDMANPENVAAQSWLETVAPRFARQLEVYEIPKGIPQTATPHQVSAIPAGGVEDYYKFMKKDKLVNPEWVDAVVEEYSKKPFGLMSNENNEIIESIGGLTNAQMWERLGKQGERSGRLRPGIFNRVTSLQDAAREKFMRFLDLLVEEKGPSEASEILTGIGKRPK